IVDDPRAYRALFDALSDVAPDRVEPVRRDTVWGSGRPLSTALMFSPPEVLARVDEAIRTATA
ncbi:hypothetical protein HER21_46475, partial [Pseudomonas sp. BGM005]|nr:hypothetical protein [Pseudomonas sp. BG5]